MSNKIGKGKSPNSLKNLKPIKKGQIMNPEGARSHNPIKKELKKFTNSYLVSVIELAVMGNLQGLAAVVKNPDSPAIQVGIAKALHKAIENGDWGTLESIVQRVVGKIPDRVHFGNDEENGIKVTFVKAEKK
jgi:hypothetical protein